MTYTYWSRDDDKDNNYGQESIKSITRITDENHSCIIKKVFMLVDHSSN